MLQVFGFPCSFVSSSSAWQCIVMFRSSDIRTTPLFQHQACIEAAVHLAILPSCHVSAVVSTSVLHRFSAPVTWMRTNPDVAGLAITVPPGIPAHGAFLGGNPMGKAWVRSPKIRFQVLFLGVSPLFRIEFVVQRIAISDYHVPIG